jgi:hypothetical protein
VLLEEEQLLNDTVDFSFKYHFVGSGKWVRNSNEIAVPDQMSAGQTGNNISLTPEALTEDAIDIVQIQD